MNSIGTISADFNFFTQIYAHALDMRKKENRPENQIDKFIFWNNIIRILLVMRFNFYQGM